MKKMMMLMSAIFLFASCVSNKSVQYVVATNYFHNNNAPMPKSLKITSEAEFNSQFGAAAFMGKDGEPTEIDFRKEFVIAKVLPVTDYETDLRMVGLQETSPHHLQLVYRLKQGKVHQSYSTQPILLIVVDKDYETYEIEERVEH